MGDRGDSGLEGALNHVDGLLHLDALLATIVAVAAYRRGAAWPTTPVLAAAALALIGRPVSGHMSQQPLGSLLDAAHVLAAGLWAGTLTALALTDNGVSGALAIG